ncbi:MAG TPA: hypothetical protein ENI95_00285 [Chloroflexi bacterium]|nr:hypothetical protein [Chloroflexota bacterium]
MPPVEAWERVLINEEAIRSGVHSFIRCTECHGGADLPDMAQAHEGMVADPSEGPDNACGECHTDIQEAYVHSLHVTLAGYDTALYERSIPENHPIIEEMESYHCSECHASCGQCHVSQPSSVGGGLLEGHEFVRTPPMSRTCTGCHGSRVRNEYTGRNEGYPADVHLTEARMNCVDCHTGEEMHGIGVDPTHRYEGTRQPRCETCHLDALSADSGILQHTIHGQDLACEVCHSIAYKNCSNCHVQQTEDGVPYYELENSWMEFRIGLNLERTPERPWQYVVVRHIPVDPNQFEFYGENLLPNFDNRPTWEYATPHNIQRVTPQSERCENCHGNPAIFLTASAVRPEEQRANASVIVRQVPSLDLLTLVEALGY